MGRLAWTSHFHPRWMTVAVLSMAGLIALTHIPQDVLLRVWRENPYDKGEHVVAYGVVAALLFLSLRRPVHGPVLAVVLCALGVIAAVDEITQPLVNRQASPLDYAADLVGVLLACLVLLFRRLGLPRAGPRGHVAPEAQGGCPNASPGGADRGTDRRAHQDSWA